MPDTLNLYYARIANMGDLLNPLIIERCFGYRVERCSFLTGDLCAIGSGLAQYKLHGNASTAGRTRTWTSGAPDSSTTTMRAGAFSSATCAFTPCAVS